MYKILVSLAAKAMGIAMMWFTISGRARWKERTRQSERNRDEKERMENIKPVSEHDLIDELRDGDF